MEINKNENLDLWFAMFSNISLLNLKKLIKKNNPKNRIEDKDLHQYIVNQTSGTNLFATTNFYRLIAKYVAKAGTQSKQEQVDKLFELLVCHIRAIRNLHSHGTNYKDYPKNKAKWEKSHEDLTSQIMSVFAKSSYGINFSKFKKNEWTAFFIQIFLHQSQWNDFYACAGIILKQTQNFYRKFRIRLRKMSLEKSFDLDVINYLKNFNSANNPKYAFLKMAIKMLNYFLKPRHINFAFAHKRRRGLIIEAQFENDKAKKFFNLEGMRKILLQQSKMIAKNPRFCLSAKNFKKKTIIPNTETKDDAFYYNKIFLPRISKESQIAPHHLLKILGKSLKYICPNDNYENGLGQTLFNQLLQFLQTEQKDYLNEQHDETKRIKNLLTINGEATAQDWITKIKNFLQAKITLKKYAEIFKRSRDKETKNKNIWTKNPMFDDIINDDDYENFCSQWFSFKGQKTRAENKIKQLIAPILIFYFYNKKPLKQDYLNDQEIANLFPSNEKLPIDISIIKNCFQKRILKTKNQLVSYKFDNNEIKQLNINYDHQAILSNYELVTSKIFFEIALLIKKETTSSLSFNNIIKRIQWYKEKELDYVAWALKHEAKKERNYIMHRSLSKFNDWEALKRVIDKKNYNRAKQNNKNSYSQSQIKNDDFASDKIAAFKEEMNQK